MSRIGAEWVIAPTAIKCTPVFATSAASAKSKSAAGFENHVGARVLGHDGGHLGRIHVVQQDVAGSGGDHLPGLFGGGHLDLNFEIGKGVRTAR